MTDLNDVQAFISVVRQGTFSAAARMAGVPTSTISRRVARLEDQLGARLLQRTTRTLSMTEAGRIFFERSEPFVDEVAEASRAIHEMQSEPRGRLRLTAPPDIGQTFWPIFDRFMKRYPEVELDLHFTQRFVDLVAEGFDLAIRGGTRPDSGAMIVRKLADVRRILIASPEYLRERGSPQRIEDLTKHDCVAFTPWLRTGTWTLHDKRVHQIQIHARFVANDLDLVRRATLAGYGIAQHFASECAADIEAGLLREVLPEIRLDSGALWAIYPSRRHLAPTVRAFIDFASEVTYEG